MDLIYFILLLSPFIVGLLFCEYEELIHPDVITMASRIKRDGGKFGIFAKLRVNRLYTQVVNMSFSSDITSMYTSDVLLLDKNGRVSKLYNISNNVDPINFQPFTQGNTCQKCGTSGHPHLIDDKCQECISKFGIRAVMDGAPTSFIARNVSLNPPEENT